jgi:hypothetical protein
MGKKFWEVVRDEHGIGGSGEYCGENDAQIGRINAPYHEALGGKYDAELLWTTRAGKNCAKEHYKKVENQLFWLPPVV